MELIQFKIYTTADGYFIGAGKIKRDIHIAKLINVSLQYYQQYLIEKFNGYIVNFTDDVYFRNEREVIKALSWIESMYVMSSLRGENNYAINSWHN